MDEILRRSLLFDFYGELLTDHQKKIYDAFDSEDLSLSEIAQQEGISRQGVHDLLRRTNKILEGYESRLHLVERFMRMKGLTEEIRDLAEDLKDNAGTEEDREQLESLIKKTDLLMDEI